MPDWTEPDSTLATVEGAVAAVMIQNIISNGSTWHETIQKILHSEMVEIEPFDHFWPFQIFMLHIYQIVAIFSKQLPTWIPHVQLTLVT